jgi:hypothetical protein
MSTNFRNLQIITSLTAPGATSVQLESFQDVPSGATGNVAVVASVGILYVISMIILCISISYGAARLSWCYNSYIGTDSGLAVLYAILAFMFSGFYYPFYALFLNPVCGFRSTAAAAIGGRRR